MSVTVSPRCKLAMIFICCVGVVLEFETGQLILWPLDHSCAPPNNASVYSNLMSDSHRQPIELEAIQRNLIAATTEDSFTLARAASMGIDFEDIERCFEYRVDQKDGQSTINMESLESCSYGLHFEEAEPNISIEAHFNLACGRQWMKILVGEAFALGLLIGFIVTYNLFVRCNSRKTADSNHLPMSIAAQIVCWLAAFLMGHSLERTYGQNTVPAGYVVGPDDDYYKLILCIGTRSALLVSILLRSVYSWSIFEDNNISVNKYRENQLYVIMFASLIVAAKILFMPIVLRIFDNWVELNNCLTLGVLVAILASALIELVHSPGESQRLLRLFLLKRESDELAEPLASETLWQSVDKHPDGEDFELVNGAHAEHMDDNNGSSSKSQRQLRAATATSTRVCEFCLVEKRRIFATSPINSDQDTTRMDPIRPLDSPTDELALSTITPRGTAMSLLSSSSSTFQSDSVYSPTTVPLGVQVMTGSNNGRASGTRAASTSLQARVQHNMSFLELDLFRWPTIGKLLLLVHLLTYNYFLFQTMPNHKLLHTETIASMLERKMNLRRSATDSHRVDMSLALATISTPAMPRQLTLRNYDLEESEPMVIYNTSSPSFASPMSEVKIEHLGNSEDSMARFDGHGRFESKRVNLASRDRYKLIVESKPAASRAAPPTPQDDNEHSPSTMTNLHREVSADGANNRTRAQAASVHESNNTAKQEALLLTRPPVDESYEFIFDYKRLDYASETLATLRDSNSVLELLWICAALNGWPIELAVVLFLSSTLSRFASSNFKLNRLFALQKLCSLALAVEWLLVALVRRRYHLIELEWLSRVVLTTSRLLSALALCAHLHVMLELAIKLNTSRLLQLRHLLPACLVALSLALLAPQFEKLDLSILPISVLASNSLAHYLASRLDSRFRRHLCPMVFQEAGF